MNKNTPVNESNTKLMWVEEEIANTGIIPSFLYSLSALEKSDQYFNLKTIEQEKTAIDEIFNHGTICPEEAEQRVKFHIRCMLAKLVEDFIERNKEIIYLALKTFSYKSQIKYLIILNEDTPENRDCIFNFLMNYYKIPLSINFIIDFQIMPRAS